jgi:hypothetical protein
MFVEELLVTSVVNLVYSVGDRRYSRKRRELGLKC